MVASKDYRPTRDEQVRQSEAATVIQQTWREWRRRREVAAAKAAQRRREEEALRRLREGMSLRGRWAGGGVQSGDEERVIAGGRG